MGEISMNSAISDSRGAFRFDAGRGAYSFSPAGAESPALVNATAMIEVNSCELYLDKADSLHVGQWQDSEAGSRVLLVQCAFAQESVSLALQFEVASDGQSVSLSAEIANTGEMTAVVGDCHLVAVDRQRGGCISLDGRPENVRFFQFKTWNVLVKTLSSDDGHHSSDLICHLSNPESGQTLFLVACRS